VAAHHPADTPPTRSTVSHEDHELRLQY